MKYDNGSLELQKTFGLKNGQITGFPVPKSGLTAWWIIEPNLTYHYVGFGMLSRGSIKTIKKKLDGRVFLILNKKDGFSNHGMPGFKSNPVAREMSNLDRLKDATSLIIVAGHMFLVDRDGMYNQGVQTGKSCATATVIDTEKFDSLCRCNLPAMA